MAFSDATGLGRLTVKGSPFELAESAGDADVPSFANGPRTLLEICHRARRFGARPLLVGEPNGGFEDLFARADGVAAHLQSRGVERIGLSVVAPSDWMAGFLGCVLAGVAPVLLDPTLTSDNLAVLARQASLTIGLTDKRGPQLSSSPLRFEAIADLKPAAAPPLGEAQASADALIVTTSGTTGAPKALVLDQLGVATGLRALLLGGALAALQDGSSGVRPGGLNPPCALVSGPLFHVSGFGPVLLALLTGAGVLVLPKWPNGDLARIVEHHKVTTISGLTPDQVSDVLAAPAVAMRSLTSINVQGGAISADMLERLQAHLAHVRITASYGLTESMGVGANAAARDLASDPHTCGRVSPLLRVRIVDRSGRDMPPGMPGEIYLQGRCLARSYCAGTEPLLAEGWFRTGDLGRLDAEGRLNVIGRAGDCAWLGERLVAAQQLETLAMVDRRVRRAAGSYQAARGDFLLRLEASGNVAEDVRARIIATIPELDGRLEITQVPQLALTKTGKVMRKSTANESVAG